MQAPRGATPIPKETAATAFSLHLKLAAAIAPPQVHLVRHKAQWLTCLADTNIATVQQNRVKCKPSTIQAHDMMQDGCKSCSLKQQDQSLARADNRHRTWHGAVAMMNTGRKNEEG